MTSPSREAPSMDAEVHSIVDTLGGPEVARVFVHSSASLGPLPGFIEKAAELDFGVERALLLARPTDVVCVSRPVEPDYLDFLRGLGLGPDPDRIVLASAGDSPAADLTLTEVLEREPRALAAICERVGSAPRVVLDPFAASSRELRLADALAERLGRAVEVAGGARDLLDGANLKHIARRQAIELGVPVAPGEIVELSPARDVGPLRAALYRQLARTGRAIVRGSRGASGSAILVVASNPGAIDAALRQVAGRTDNHIYLVEAMLELVVSPNVLVHVEPGAGRVRCVGLSDQRLDAGLAHSGNVCPTLATTAVEMVAAARRLAGWLRRDGFTGLAGFDFVEYQHPGSGRRDFVLAEVNARTNGAAYPKCAMDHLNAGQTRQGRPALGAFLAASDLHTTLRSFAALRKRCASLLFDPGAGRGVLPYNTGSLVRGRLRAVAFGQTRAEVEALHAAFCSRISG